MSEIIHSKFGNLKLRDNGYYQVTSSKEGNFGKFFHRLLFEDFYNCKIPNGFVIHHKDGNCQNNCVLNLQMLSKKEHSRVHSTIEHNVSKSDLVNTTGFYRVIQVDNPNTAQGYYWKYQYYVNGKRRSLCSVDLFELEDKVKEKGLEWIELDN